jgi:hypothetical protein
MYGSNAGANCRRENVCDDCFQPYRECSGHYCLDCFEAHRFVIDKQRHVCSQCNKTKLLQMLTEDCGFYPDREDYWRTVSIGTFVCNVCDNDEGRTNESS